MTMYRSTQGAATAALLVGAWFMPLSAPSAAELPVSFEEEIMPILQRRCVECHQPGGEGYEASGFDLRTYEGLMKGTKYGPMVVPGDPFVSNLMVVLEGRANRQIHMPFHEAPLRRCYVQIIKKWISEGAEHN